MHYVALATDYDGTIAHDGAVDDATMAALERLRAACRRLILVTGRELDDLVRVMPRLDLFDRVVAENGALLYCPKTREERPLAAPPPPAFVERLREMEVSPLSVGRVIVASWEPNEAKVLAAIRDLGLELQITFNKGAVMVLPAGVTKESGLRAALEELEISPRNCVAVGDAENDFAFLDLCGLPVAVANALPSLKADAVLVTTGVCGAGVVELIERMLATDLAELDDGNPRQQVALATPLPGEPGTALTFVPQRQSLLLAGVSGGGKTTLTTGLLERLAEHGFQYCVIDPEGDYEDLESAISVGTPDAPPRVEKVLELLRKTPNSVAVNLLGVALADRPAFFAALLPELQALRARIGRPHFVVVDEAHHVLPAGYDPGGTVLPDTLAGFLFVTVRPEALSSRMLGCVDRVIAVGPETLAALKAFCQARGLPPPEGPDSLPAGELLTLSVTDPAPRHLAAIPGRDVRRRHQRKYAEGKLGDDKSFFFRGPHGRLNLRATNLQMFVEMADGVDEETWEWHRRKGDYSRWVGLAIKDHELTEQVAVIEQGGMPTGEAKARLRAEIERRYTLPA
ncbi:MAG: Cof-type HAD-IIB family hydrolase [Pseudomonadota bacterium]|nr:Cof-type HAD-IIB family hydrolase [Pseudomonadota bacterium]